MPEKVDVRNKRCFISGPMSGLKYYNVTSFALAHAILREANVEIAYDPSIEWLMSYGPEHAHGEYLRICIHELTRKNGTYDEPYYDYLVQLDGWENSLGAKTECEVAKACGIKCISIREVADGSTKD